MRTPDRGDIVWLEFDPQAGHEQAGRRPALILSAKQYNGVTGLALACPVTSRVKGYPFEVALTGARSVQGVILADQIRSVDWRARRAKFAERAPAEVLSHTLAMLRALLA